jgi:CheY-like chemotaxis protein
VDTIEAMTEDINQVKGSRILWIDDNPLTILGERRLLRALGLQIVMEADSENARMRLKNDSDFDLIISDLQRTAKTDKKVTIHDGALFVKEIRQDSMHPAIKNIPIIIYSAFREASVNILKDKGVTHFENIELCDTIETLLTKVILTLVQVRNNPIKVESRKKATSPQ